MQDSPTRRLRRGVIATVTVGLTLPWGSSPAHGQTSELFYEARASADTFTLLLENDAIPVGLSPQVSGPLAQVAQGNLDATALASVAYPGDTAADLVPTASSLYGVAAPAYPVRARNTLADREPTRTNAPGAEMEADATLTTSRAKAVIGSDASGSLAEAQVSLEDGDVVVDARSESNLVAAGQALSASGVVSRVQLSGGAGFDGPDFDDPVVSLEIGAIRVPGLAITIPESTPGYIPTPVPVPVEIPSIKVPVTAPIPLGGQTLEVPTFAFRDGGFYVQLPGFGATQFPVPTGAMVAALDAAGYEALFQQGTVTTGPAPGGRGTVMTVVGPTLRLTTVYPSPPENDFFDGETRATYVFGQSVASITIFDGAAAGPGATVDLSGATPTDVVSSLPVLGAPAPFIPSSTPGPALATAPTTGSGAPDLIAAPQQLTPVLVFGEAQYFDAGWFYVMFVAVALSAVGGATAIRYLGVRTQWT